MTEKTPETVLITGGSKGIGLEIAKQFARNHYNLVLVSRDEKTLDEVAQSLHSTGAENVISLAIDLSQADSPQALYQEIQNRGIQIDVLVNNAGVGLYGNFAEADQDQELQMMQLNMLTLTTLTKLFLKPMLKRGHGRVLNVASLVAYQPGGARMAVYYATKSYVLSFSKGLSVELRGTGVKVTALCPGPVATNFEFISGADKTVLYRLPKLSPKRVAIAAYRATRRGSRIVIPGFLSKILAFAGELPPRRIALEVNNLLLKKL